MKCLKQRIYEKKVLDKQDKHIAKHAPYADYQSGSLCIFILFIWGNTRSSVFPRGRSEGSNQSHILSDLLSI